MSSSENLPNIADDSYRLKRVTNKNSHRSKATKKECEQNKDDSLTSNYSPAPNALRISSILHDPHTSDTAGKHKSAFLPYRPPPIVLTNLQRGNTEATFCPAEVILSFHERAGQGEITDEQIKLFLKENECNIDVEDSYGLSPLHWAAYYGQLNSAQLLVDAGANVNKAAPELVTPLLLAASGGHHDVVRYLLLAGADCKHMDIIGNTALMYAAAGNHPHTCNELLSKDPDISVSNENGDTAYTLAVQNGALLAQAILEQHLTALLTL